MKKRLLSLTILTAMIAAPSYSQPSDGSKGTFTITPAYVSTYMFRGVRFGGQSFQPVIDYSRGPLTLGLCASLPVDEKIADSIYPECDFFASYEWAIVPDVFKITPGVIVLTWPTINETEDGMHQMICGPSLSFGYTVKGLTFSLNLYYDLVLKGATYEFGADYSIPVKPLGIDLEFSARAGTYKWLDIAPSTKITETGNYWSAGVAIPYSFSDSLKLTVGWLYTSGFDNYHKTGQANKIINPGAVGRGVFSAGLSYSF
jgi:hypothetical protein